ncbi:hypothetical protein CONLIGDRAFT_618329 [Coniochaeta ligniaria NRRL 30616]|uniref:RING-type domain-containing protein n=1 Tax=Coniochaeta ligniaria NRRL 30616 TaxID=1408157 RepID=A0A1J7INT9_9PEZI|nr:hypothetical protein CONLIGDRAFT_618329 [Coniochaeta ligniaria NRRL 30616]
MASSSHALTCVACHDPLVMSVESDSDSDSDAGQPGPSSSAQASSSSAAQETVPDDLHLPCGCHFHWQCLLDQSPQIASTLSCPNCSTTLTPNPSSGIQAVYSSEGGQSEPVDLLPLVQEEAHLQTHTEERPGRALHTMAGEGDVEGIVSLLRDAEDTPAERAALLRYRDPLGGGRNALHVAVENGKADAFWLLLWVASDLPTDNFSTEMRQTMGSIRLQRGGGEDLRFVQDVEGRTPGDYAAASGEWDEWINGGVFMLRS